MASKKSIIRAQTPIRVKGNTKCKDHKEDDVVVLCQDCNDLICIRCTITSHKFHVDSFLELSKTKLQNQKIIQDFVNETDKVNIPKLSQEIISSRTKMSSCKPMYDKLRKSIIDNNNQCKLQLDRIAKDHISICDKMEVAATDLIQTHIKNLEERLDTLRKLSSECKQTLQTGTDVLMHDSVSEIQEMDPDIPPTPNMDMTEFTPGKDRQGHLKQAMGNIKLSSDHLQAGSATGGQSDQRPVVRSKHSTQTRQASTGAVRYKLRDRPTVMSQISYPDNISSICPTSDGRAWLCDWTDTVKLIDNKGQVKQRIQHNSYIHHISLDPTTGRLWFCCFSERTICEVSTSSAPVTRFITDDVPARLCVTKEGRIVVGTYSKKGNKVVMYTKDGQVLHIDNVESSGTGEVQSITQCGITGNIAVVSGKLISGDFSPDNYRRRIIVYNPTLQPLVHYRGEGIKPRGAISPDMFDPWTVVYDSKSNIVIVDRTRKTIELISGAGKYITTLHTNKGFQGLVGIQKGDVLWSYLELDTGECGLRLLKYYSD